MFHTNFPPAEEVLLVQHRSTTALTKRCYESALKYHSYCVTWKSFRNAAPGTFYEAFSVL